MKTRNATATKRVPRAQALSYDMVATEPILVVQPGEVFEVETEDVFNNIIRDETPITPQTLGKAFDRLEFNPCAGPIAIEGARAGDTLAVHIHDIEVAEQGFTALLQMWGPWKDSASYPDCRGPVTKVIKHLPGPSGTTSDGTGVYSERISWPLRPHIGTIGTAPLRSVQSGADSLLGQGAYGGNMDSRDICKGHTVYLPVANDGGHLYLGDVHASMADAEFAGLANETRALVTLSCDVISQKMIPWVRVETPTEIIQLHSFKPLDEAIRQAFFWLVDWMVEDYGFSARDAALQMGANPDVRIHVYQMVLVGRLNYTVGVSIPKRYLE